MFSKRTPGLPDICFTSIFFCIEGIHFKSWLISYAFPEVTDGNNKAQCLLSSLEERLQIQMQDPLSCNKSTQKR